MVRTGSLGQDFYNAVQSNIVSQEILERLGPITDTNEMWRQEIKEQDEIEPYHQTKKNL